MTLLQVSPAPQLRVALVDDDALFRESLGLNLSDEGFDVLPFPDGPTALAYFEGGKPADLILLDWRMPGIDGIEVLKRLRGSGVGVPVIFLTVLNDQIYEEAALAGGAVDFVEKSRSLTILLRRIKLILEGRKNAEDAPGVVDGELRYGDLRLNVHSCRAVWGEDTVDLTLTEFHIVKMMVARPGTDISYREIYDVVRGKGFIAGYGTLGYRANVRAFIKRIRHKFRSVDDSFEEIENYPGFGYRWREIDP